ncbi:MAG TPA: DNA-binding response regulator, partial [Clostridium sp.]|nr:DNA-binding response regulator [Clostridium sp.]
MNLSVAAGISSPGNGTKDFLNRFEEAGEQLRLKYLKGKGKICDPWEKDAVSFQQVRQAGQDYEKLIKGLMIGDEFTVWSEKKGF